MYAVINRCAWGTGAQPVAETPGAIPCASYADMREAVQALSGRATVLSIPSVSRHLERTGRVYVAPASGMRGALVERVR